MECGLRSAGAAQCDTHGEEEGEEMLDYSDPSSVCESREEEKEEKALCGRGANKKTAKKLKRGGRERERNRNACTRARGGWVSVAALAPPPSTMIEAWEEGGGSRTSRPTAREKDEAKAVVQVSGVATVCDHGNATHTPHTHARPRRRREKRETKRKQRGRAQSRRR